MSPKFFACFSVAVCLIAGAAVPPELRQDKATSSQGKIDEKKKPDAETKLTKTDDKKEHKFDPLFVDWEKPEFAIFLSGQLTGYIEPCGCTGLDTQKGGLLRRDTLRQEIIKKGWNLVSIDAGDQIKRFGLQPLIKLRTIWEALTKIFKTQAIAFGPHDLKTSDVDLLQAMESAKVGDDIPFVAANISWIEKGFVVPFKVIKVGNYKIGVTAVLGNESKDKFDSGVFEITDSDKALDEVWPQMAAEGCNVHVLIAHTNLDESRRLAKKFPHFDVLATTGGLGEPTKLPEEIKVGNHTTSMIQVGTKGMHVGVIGFFKIDNGLRLQYQRVPLDHRFKDSEAMKKVFKSYQDQLKLLGLKNLGIKPVPRPDKRRYVGSKACKDCHEDSYDIWKRGIDKKGGPHFRATSDLTDPGERTWVTREHDPECLSCHVTGWNPQRYFPYESGYLTLKDIELHGNGCENCHGPGSIHVDVENGDLDVSDAEHDKITQSMILTLEEARKTQCVSCHDHDNSPDFEFDKYWEQIKHYEDEDEDDD